MKRDDAIRWLLGQDDDTDWDIVKHREKRSLSQNAYYWVLVGKMAKYLRISTAELHNRLLRSYGQVMIVDGMIATTYLPDTDEAEQKINLAETFHLRPTSTVVTPKPGKTLRAYIIMRGSSGYNTEEMGTLLDGTVEEARQMGIETLTPGELERMRVSEEHHKQ